MTTLSYFNPDLEIYSIDEAFLSISEKNPPEFGDFIRNKVLKWTGIEISVGIAKTKTLAKIANHLAKKQKGVCFPDEQQWKEILDRLPVKEVWGIGSRSAQFLHTKGCHFVSDLLAKDDLWIKRNLSVTGLRTVWELRGIPCFSMEQSPPPKKSLLTSRTFGNPITTKESLFEALAAFATRNGEKLREMEKKASWMLLFIETSRHKEERYANQINIGFSRPTNYTPDLLDAAKKGLDCIYRFGLAYKRAGVLLGGFTSARECRGDLFSYSNRSENADKKRYDLMLLMDEANRSYGYDILQFASLGKSSDWKGKSDLRSPCYTTRWEEILTLQI